MEREPTPAAVLKKLKSLGTAKNVTVYRRHGVNGPIYGVSFEHLSSLARSIGKNHRLAVRLWASGIHDARILATMIADAGALTSAQLNQWAKALDNYVVADAFSKLVRTSPLIRAKAAAWTTSRNDWIGQVGWNLVAFLALSEVSLTEAEFSRYVETIATHIHASRNRTRYAMNSALIAIGIRSAPLKQKALRAAARIGAVAVDHGATGCKTPDARQYIVKSWNRKMA